MNSYGEIGNIDNFCLELRSLITYSCDCVNLKSDLNMHHDIKLSW